MSPDDIEETNKQVHLRAASIMEVICEDLSVNPETVKFWFFAMAVLTADILIKFSPSEKREDSFSSFAHCVRSCLTAGEELL